MRRLTYLVSSSLAALALVACGGGDDDAADDDGTSPDAAVDSPPAGACGVETTTISTYPAMYSGAVKGAGDDLDVAETACADERGFYGPYGEDQVIALTGLTAGTTYVLDLVTDEDLGMYVTSTCSGGMPASGSCLLLVDEFTRNETGEFVAPAGGSVFVIIDTADGVTLTDGAYMLSVRAAECTDNTGCSGATPYCNNFECVQCTSSFDCTTSGAPLCDGATNSCVAGNAQCTGDDAAEQDDGPAAARAVTFPTAGTPTTFSSSICSLPAIEGDWYKVTATGASSIRVSATWADTNADIDVLVYDSTGTVIAQGIASGPGPEAALATLPAAGDYYIEVYEYEPADPAAATPYTLGVALPECATSFDCTMSSDPICNVGDCVPGPAQCTGDDDAEPADDGPAGARDLTGAIGVATTRTGNICNTPSAEADWYKVTTTLPGEGLVANLSWTAGPDLDVYIYDSMGRLLGTSFWLNPEVVTVDHLPAGTYYFLVNRAGTAVAAGYAYSLSVTRTAVALCTTTADCASTYKTQLYRGDCTAGTCQFLAAGTRTDGMACDSGDDCMSGRCSYIPFESDAQDSICSHNCTSNADCSSLTGTVCMTGFATNFCQPSCTTNFECGANVQSDTVETDEPWDYFTCTTATGACSP
jgi:hypothetical protein